MRQSKYIWIDCRVVACLRIHAYVCACMRPLVLVVLFLIDVNVTAAHSAIHAVQDMFTSFLFALANNDNNNNNNTTKMSLNLW